MSRKTLRGVSFGDIHANSASRRWAFEREAIAQLAQKVAAENADLFLCNGDLAGRETNHRYTTEERRALSEMFVEMLESAPGFVIGGNHDRELEAEVLDLLGGRRRNVLVVADEGRARKDTRFALRDESILVQVVQVPYVGESALFHQYGLDGGRDAAGATIAAGALLTDRLRVLPDPDAYVIGQAHFPVEGVKVGPYEVESSQDVTIERGALEASGVQFWGVGHIHSRIRLSDNAEYSGNPFCLDYGERGPRGYSVFEIDPDGKLTIEHRNLDTWDMVTVDVGDLGADLDLSDWTLWTDPATRSDIGKCFVKLRYQLPAGVPIGVVPEAKIADEIKRRGALGVDFEPSYARIERNERAPEVVAAASDEDKLREALHDDPDVDPAAVVQRFTELMKEFPCTD